MCTGLELLIGAGSLFGAAAPLLQKTPKPPKVEVPAADPGPALDTNADVRDEDTATNTDIAPEYTGFAPKRLGGTAIGGLGKSSLAL